MKILLALVAVCSAAVVVPVKSAVAETTHPSGDWVVTKLTVNASDSVITEGTLRYAYAPAACTANGVTFVKNSKLADMTDDIEVVPAFGYDKSDHNNNDQGVGAITDNAWKDLLGRGWLNNNSNPAVSTFTFKNLTKGNVYKVQLLIHNGYNKENPARSIFTPDGQEGFYSQSSSGDHSDWDLGCSLAGTFIATNTSHQMTFSYSSKAVGWKNLNAIQVRDLGAYVPTSINARAANMIPGDWIVCPLSGDAGDIVTRGDKVEALSATAIAGDTSTDGLSFKAGYAETHISFDLWSHYASSALGDCGLSGAYGTLLSNGYCGQNQNTGRKINLFGLEPGRLYLLQGFVHDASHPERQLTIAGRSLDYSADDVTSPWYYGGTFVYLFEASASSCEIALDYPLYGALLNGVQLRQLPDVTHPSFSSSIEVLDTTVTITISDVVAGMGWDASAASSCEVYAKLNDKEFAKVVEGVTATTSFEYEDLDSGNYDCTIYIINDKGVRSAESVVSFEIGSSEPQTYVVTKKTDDLTNPEEGSLRWALSMVRTGDTVTFDKEQMGTDTITIVGVAAARADTSLVIRKAVTIEGNGVVIDGGWNGVAKSDAGGRIFLIPEDVGQVTIRNLTMRNGHGRGWGAAGSKYFQGGAMCALSPVRFENCSFVRNCSADETAYAPSEARGGGAIYAQANVELESCLFQTNCIPCGSTSHGGAIYMASGSLVARRCVFDANYSESYTGGIFASAGATSVLMEDCKVEHSFCVGGNGVHAGFMWTKIPAGEGKFIRFTRCVFRDNYIRNSGGHGGVLFAEDSAPVTIVDCEFADNRAHTGGSVRTHGKPTICMNCTFTGGAMTGDTWGPTLDLRDTAYVVNCTFGGNFFLNNANPDGGSATASGGSPVYLNCACAYNYRNAGEGVAEAIKLNGDIGKYSGGWTFVNTIGNGKSADGTTDILYAASLDGVDTASKLFADYRTVNTVKVYGADARLKDDYVVPAFADDSKGAYFSRVFAPVKGGLLDGTGWPVKVNADYSHICYSSDGGDTWTDLYKNGNPDDSTLTLIAADQRGVPYKNGIPPIGAATVASSVAGFVLVVR